MSLDNFNVVRPGQTGGVGPVDAQHVEEYTGSVENTIQRRSVLAPRVPIRTVRGTSVITQFASGQSQLQVLQPGVTPNGTLVKFGKLLLQVDTAVLARATVPMLDEFQTSYDARVEIGKEHGEVIARFTDQAFFIIGAKTALLTQSAYAGMTPTGASAPGNLPTGHFGGSQIPLTNAGDESDPAALYAGILDLCTEMEEVKDVDVQADDVTLYVRPSVFNVLIQNEQLINAQYITATGNQIQGYLLKANGMPVVKSNNLPNGVVTGHYLSNAKNGQAYDGDFSDLVVLALSPRAIMAGATIPLETKVFFDDVSKHWFIDAWTSFAVGPNRAEFAGVITKV